MKKRLIFGAVALSICILAFASCENKPTSAVTDTSLSSDTVTSENSGDAPDDGYNYGDVKIHAISELNLTGEVDDHAKTVGSSNFELNYREYVQVPRKSLGTANPYYPRLKKVSDNNYLLFYNIGKTDPSCFLTRSSDLKEWDKGTALFEGTVDTHYATCDAVVLKNGDILAVASFRPVDWGAYTSDMTKSGLVLRRSTDGGKTWSDMTKIYTGMNWEPYLLQLESGEVQCFFTHTAPYTHLYGYNNKMRSSGVGLIRSYDNGATWTPNVTEAPYSADIASQTYIGTMQGYGKMFNEQMPSVVELHSGSMLMAAELLPDFNDPTKFRLTITRSHDNWKKLALDEQGPSDKQTIADVHATGPYVAQMKSGETVISYNGTKGLNIIVGNSEGKNFSAATQPLADFNKTYWGSLEVLGSHAFLAACDDDTKSGNVEHRRISYGTMYLNHDINAKKMTATLDGDSMEWEGNTDAIFVGSNSQAQASVRFAEDTEHIYILCERLDEKLSSKDDVDIFLAGNNAKEYYKLTVSPKGVEKVVRFENKKPADFDSSVESYAVCVGTVGYDDDTDTGYSVELKLKKSEFSLSLSDGVRATLALENKDGSDSFDSDKINGHTVLDTGTWTYISAK